MVLCVTQTAAAGGYFSLVKIIVMMLLAVPWLLVSPWVHQSAKRILSPVAAWSGGVLAAGAVGLFLWLNVPHFALGLLLYLVAVGGVIGSYIIHHNARCNEADKVLTASFFASLTGKRKAKHIDVLASRA